MDIKSAYDILYRYFTKTELRGLYRKKGFDASESDTIRKHEYNAELLNELYFRIEDESEKENIASAAKVFRDLADEEWVNI